MDVLPTALHILGLAVPTDVDGVVRLELFERDSDIATRPVSFVEPAGPLESDSGDEFDDEAIKEKLRGLGYMH